MLSVFQSERESKSLYFKLNNAFHLLDVESSKTYKIAGVYAIFKDDVCHYVGQSKNLPSRISTHLCGKYSNANLVRVWFAGETEGYDANGEEFYIWSKPEQTEALEANESLCMSFFNPVENIYIHGDGEGDDGWILTPEIESAAIRIEDNNFTTSRSVIDAMSIHSDLLDTYTQMIKEGN